MLEDIAVLQLIAKRRRFMRLENKLDMLEEARRINITGTAPRLCC